MSESGLKVLILAGTDTSDEAIQIAASFAEQVPLLVPTTQVSRQFVPQSC